MRLDNLITAAIQLAGTDDQISHNARLWQMEGGRACPLGWGGCSQPVYVDLKTGEHDYGEPGGPGHADCVANCRHGMNPPPCDDDDESAFLEDNPPEDEADAAVDRAIAIARKAGAGAPLE